MSKLVSAIVEWENAKLSDLGRAECMLARLGTQMADAARRRDFKAELLVLYDSDEIDPAVPHAAIASRIDKSAWPGTIELIPAPGKRYYEQKNAGARLAKGEILVFLDSDVVPDEGWLDGLLSALDDPTVDFVGGEAYHATDTLHDRLFAAFWAFPPKHRPRGVYRRQTFYANNLAVRREIFLANPFPEAAAYRGQCSQLAKTLRSNGISVYRQGASAVSHPPPRGARTMVVRAVCEGHDAIYWKSRQRFGVLHTNPAASTLRWLRALGQVLSKVATRARSVGLGPLGALAAVGMGFAYYSCKLGGEVIAFFAPDAIRRNFSV